MTKNHVYLTIVDSGKGYIYKYNETSENFELLEKNGIIIAKSDSSLHRDSVHQVSVN